MIRVRILKNRGARVTRDTKHGPVERFVRPDGELRVDEAAAFLGMSLNRVYRRIESGQLPANRKQEPWTVKLADVKALADEEAA